MMESRDIFRPEYAPYREALAVFAAYRRLGFATENIFFVAAPEEETTCIYMLLRCQGKDFTFGCGVVSHDAETVHKTWQAVGALWNKTLTHEEQDRIYKKSLVSRNGLQLLIGLQEKGFKIPNDDPAGMYTQLSN